MPESIKKYIQMGLLNKDKTKYRFGILFVCLGNICRSPSAEAVFRAKVREAGLEDAIDIDSAGLMGYHTGERADLRSIRHAAKRGYDVTSIARRFDPERDFERFDLIVPMDRSNLRELQRLARKYGATTGIRLMTDFCTGSHPGEVPDPYYGGEGGFEYVLDLLEDASVGLLEYVQKEIGKVHID